MSILGINTSHDSSYFILKNGHPVIHEESERFTRVKALDNVEINELFSFLNTRNILYNEYDYIINGNYGYIVHDDLKSNKSYKEINEEINNDKPFFDIGHHLSHASSAFYTSNFKDSIIICIDGHGHENMNYYNDSKIKKSFSNVHPTSLTPICFSIFDGNDRNIKLIDMFEFEWGKWNKYMIGYLYELLTTAILNISKGGREGVVMAMASIGNPKFKKIIYDILENKYSIKKNELTIVIQKIINNNINNAFDIAASLQDVVEEIFRDIVKPYICNYKNVCISGGFSLNCVLLGKIKQWFNNIENIHCDPVPYDGGLCIGASFYLWNNYLNNPRTYWEIGHLTPYLGKIYSKNEVLEAINYNNINYIISSDEEILEHIGNQKVIAVFGGGAESGRRALGNRSIIADPREKDMLNHINNNVKHRQWFRPVSPSIMRDEVSKWFVEDIDSPYMSFAIKFKEEVREKVPAVVHVDGTGRLQTVTEKSNKWYYNLLRKWKEKTGIPILINTSFNDSEPIVETPEDAIKCFNKTNIDYLYFYDYNFLIKKV